MRVTIPVVRSSKAATSVADVVPSKTGARTNRKSRGIWNSFRFRRTAGLTLMTTTGLVMLAFVAGCPPPTPPPVPTDAQDSCPLPAATFADWLQPSSVVGGVVQLNGVANPADSRVGPAPNCGFYQSSEQSVLWLSFAAPAA